MKIRYFMPLGCYLALCVWCSLFFMPEPPSLLLNFFFFLGGFSLTYFFGVKETIKNKEAVYKFNTKAPYIVPFLLFGISTTVTSFFLMPPDIYRILEFSSCGVGALASYAVGMVFMLGDLKRDIKKSAAACERQRSIRPGNKKRLLLINPVNPCKTGLTVNLSSRFPPLALGIIAALTPDDFEVELIDENMEGFSYKHADLVGITTFTASAARAYELAVLYRKNGIPVVMGGIHASMCAEEALRYADSVVLGEAEDVWPGLIKDFLKGNLKRTYQAEARELDRMPTARRDIFSPLYGFATVQTSRGCPMDCEFCSVTVFNGRRYRQRPVEQVLDELAGIKERHIFFVDDNIIGYSRESAQRAVQFFKGMVERKLNKSWFCQASLNFGLDHKVLFWAHKAGCKMVFLGLESPNVQDLKDMNKKVNLRIDYKKALANIHRHKIAVLGAFINGTPADTAGSMAAKASCIVRFPVDVIQTTVLTPFPGTRLFERLRRGKRLIYTDFPADWPRYDMTELTFKLDYMTQADFIKTDSQCNKRFYSMLNLVKKFFKTMLQTRSMECAFWAWNSNRNYRTVSLKRTG